MSTQDTIQIGSLTIPPEEQTPLVRALLEIIRRQDQEIKALRDEIHKFKGATQRPKIESSRLLKPKKPAFTRGGAWIPAGAGMTQREGEAPAEPCRTEQVPIHSEFTCMSGRHAPLPWRQPFWSGRMRDRKRVALA